MNQWGKAHEDGHWSLVELKSAVIGERGEQGSVVIKLRRLKASKPFIHANSNASYDYRQFVAFSADSVH
jgi:hypothetical protein